MKDFIDKIRKIFSKGSEIIRFLIIGGISTLIDIFVMSVVIYLPCRHQFSGFFSVFTNNSIAPGYLVALGSLVGFLVGLAFNFVFSIHYVYLGDNKYVKNKKSFFIFALLSFIGLVIQTVGVFIGYEIFKINEWIMKIIFIIIVLIFNYITRKKFIFNKNDQEQKISKAPIKERVKILEEKDYKYLTFFAFSGLFLIYLLISIIANYYLNADKDNTLFGNDSSRIIGDWSEYSANHYRTKVHPLYVILIYPIITFFKMLGLNPVFAIIALISFNATINVYLVYKILIKISNKNLGWLNLVFAIFYAFAFAQVGHVLIIESFILGSFSLLVFWTYFVYNFRKENKWYHTVWQLSLIGTLVFGFITTNIFHFFLGTAVLLILNKKKSFKQLMIDCGVYLLTVFTTFVICCVLVCIQKFIFPSSLNPIKYIFIMIGDVLHGTHNGEEMLYVNKEISFNKLVTELLNYLGVAFSGGKVCPGYVLPNFITYVVSSVVAVLIGYTVTLSIKNKNNIHLVLTLCGCYLFEFCFHYFYGYSELMLYAVNFSFIPYLIIANGLSSQNNKFKKYINWSFVGLCALCVLSSFITMLFVLRNFYQHFGFSHRSVLKTNYYFILLTSLTLASIFLFITVRKYLEYRKNATEVEKNQCQLLVIRLVAAVLVFVCVFFTFSICTVYKERKQVHVAQHNSVEIPNNLIEQKYDYGNAFAIFGMGQRNKYVIEKNNDKYVLSKLDVATSNRQTILDNLTEPVLNAQEYSVKCKKGDDNVLICENEEF